MLLFLGALSAASCLQPPRALPQPGNAPDRPSPPPSRPPEFPDRTIGPGEGPAPSPGGVSSRIRSEGGRRYLEVNGAPFIVLAVQPDAWVLAKRDSATRQFRFAREVGANTIEVPIPWIHVEPERDRYTMDYVRWVLDQARASDLKLVLLWFGSNVVGKTGSPTELKIVPAYVQGDPKSFPRVSPGAPRAENPLEPNHPATLEREKRAFAKVLEFIAAQDREGRVILWQILNEVGVLPETKVPYPENVLTDKLVAHVRALTQLEKRIHPVPAFMNFWEGLQGAKPFEFLSRIPELDFVAPDLYGKQSLGFHIADRDYVAFRDNYMKQLDRYSQGRNLVFVAETNTDAYFRPHLLLFPLLGKVPGIGMDIWAITHGSMRGYEPLVDPKSGQITESGARVREVYRAIDGARVPIVRAQGSPRLGWMMSEGPASGRNVNAGGIPLVVDTKGDGALLALRDVDGALVVVGRNVRVTVPRPPSQKVQRGRFERERWIADGELAPSPGESVSFTLDAAAIVRIAP